MREREKEREFLLGIKHSILINTNSNALTDFNDQIYHP